jgi:hypothetical protein
MIRETDRKEFKISGATDSEMELEDDVLTQELLNENNNVYGNNLYNHKNKKEKEKIIFYEFLNFLETYIHTILYLRKVYPSEAFYPFRIYNLPFLKFITDDEVTTYINDFLQNIEKFLFLKYIKKIYILIIDSDEDNSKITEIFNLNISFPDTFYEYNYKELCLNFKSILNQLYIQFVNKNTNIPLSNDKTFALCIETLESRVISNIKVYDEILNSIEGNFVKNLFRNDVLSVFRERETCVILDDVNLSINISRNYYK